MTLVEAVNKLRHANGLSLREAHDLVLGCGGVFNSRTPLNEAALEAAQKKINEQRSNNRSGVYISPEQKCREAIKAYYAALDKRLHGHIAASKALDAIQEALGMTWVEGATLNKDK